MTKNTHRWTALTLCLAPLLCAGLCGEPCDPDDIEVSPAEVSEGEVSWENGGAFESALTTRAFPSETDCTLGATIGSSDERGRGATSAIIDSADLPVIKGHFDIRCFSFEDPQFFSVSITTSDPRQWPLGEVDPEVLGATVRLTSRVCDDTDECSFCVADPPDVTIRVVVEEATGGAEGFPDGVTEDFVRALHLEIDTGDALTGDACGSPVRAEASARFNWTRESFTFSENCPQDP